MATKGLSKDGSTRSWRRGREAAKQRAKSGGKYKCAVCGTTRNLQLDHPGKGRRGGVKDSAAFSRGKWYCPKHNPNTGRPKGS